jgi:phosphonopyruvate decarboxylase
MQPELFLETLGRNGIRFFSGVPDSLLKELCKCITATVPSTHHLIAANEGAAVALATGYHLGTGEYGCVYLQNSGLGNVVNPLTSIADPEVYAVPMLLIVGWRGEPGVKDEPQHVKQGRVTPAMLEALEVPYLVLDKETDPVASIGQAVALMKQKSAPVALLVRKDAFEATSASAEKLPAGGTLSREEAIELVAETISPDSVVVATTGFTSRELYEYRLRKGQQAPKDFLTVGGMGHTASIAAGIAIAQPDRQVVCLDGDGSVLMHMGALPVIGKAGPKNLLHIVLNNGVHDSVGAQPTAGFSVDFQAVARASGYRTVAGSDTREGMIDAVRKAAGAPGPVFIELRIRPGARKDLGRPKSTPLENKANLMQQIGTVR